MAELFDLFPTLAEDERGYVCEQIRTNPDVVLSACNDADPVAFRKAVLRILRAVDAGTQGGYQQWEVPE